MPERLKKLRKELARKGREPLAKPYSRKPPVVESRKFVKEVKPVAVFKGPWREPTSFKLKKKWKKKLGGRRSILSALQRSVLGVAISQIEKKRNKESSSISPGV